MSSPLTLRGAALKHVVIQADETGVFCRLTMAADHNQAVQDRMGWPDLPLAADSMTLSGELTGGTLRLTSQQPLLNGTCPEMQISTDHIGDFEAVRVKDEDKEATRVELRFKVRSRDPHCAALAYEYKSAVKKTLSDLVLREDRTTAAPPVVDDKQTVIDFRAKQQAQDDASMDNGLNAMGSGRTRRKRTRGEMSEADATEAADRAALASQLAGQLE